jgi:hypothetical protein
MLLGTLLGVFMPIYYVLEKNLESFYVFNPEDLHNLSKRAIAAHGNDTKSIVEYIVTELQSTHGPYVNPNSITHEEWIFNNAGGAMGAMTLIHASESLPASTNPRHNPADLTPPTSQASPSTSSSSAPPSAPRDTPAATPPTTTSTS